MFELVRGTLIAVAVAYFIVCVAMWALQRRFLFVVEPRHVAPETVGLAGIVAEQKVKTADGETLVFWSARPHPVSRHSCISTAMQAGLMNGLTGFEPCAASGSAL